MFIFYNQFYNREFKRPKSTYVRNIKLVQAIMTLMGELFDFQYYFIEHCFYWKTPEKTLLTLNTCLFAFLGALPLLLVPLRYVVVLGMWGFVASFSPFLVAVGQAIAQIMIEYGIVFERLAPGYMTEFHHRFETVYIPRLIYFLSWIPYVNRYLPELPQRDKVMH